MVDLLDRPGVVSGVSPGFYFQRCLPIFTEDLQRRIRQGRAEAVRPVANADTGRTAPAAIVGDITLYRALLHRHEQTFQQLRASFDGVALRLRNLAPFVTGVGQPHPLETGFAFLKPYGVPYLAGSGVKGAVRAACAAVWEGEKEASARLKHYFGSESKDERDEAAHRRGALVFLDLLPDPDGLDAQGWSSALRLDIVNPHYAPYYQGKDAPADWHQPVPSFFLTLRADLDWWLRIVYAPGPDVHGDGRRPQWIDEIRPGLEVALTEQGLGAKKTWGYGLFKITEWDGRGPAAAEPSASEQMAAGPAPVPRGPRAAAQAVEARIQSLRSQDVKPQADALRRDLERCTEGERGSLLDAIEARLKQFRWRRRDMDDVMTRLRRPFEGQGN